MKETMAPSLTIFNRSGLWEMMAAVLFSVATDTISINYSESFSSESKPIPEDERPQFKRDQWYALTLSFLILALAAYREAYMIINL